jgi:hypothetical protein
MRDAAGRKKQTGSHGAASVGAAYSSAFPARQRCLAFFLAANSHLLRS